MARSLPAAAFTMEEYMRAVEDSRQQIHALQLQNARLQEGLEKTNAQISRLTDVMTDAVATNMRATNGDSCFPNIPSAASLPSIYEKVRDVRDELSQIFNGDVERATAQRELSFARRMNKWLRVWMCFITSGLVAGLIPGQAMFIQMFVDFGVNSSLCSDQRSPCTAQQIRVSSGFNIGFALALLCFIPSGWMFDRYGAQKVCLWGAGMTFIGLLLLEIPLLAVAYGYDAYTSWLFPIIITFTDAGSMGSAYAVMGMVYHFPGRQTFILALWSCGGQVAPALLPNALSLWMELTGMDLPSAFGVYTIVVAASTAVMYMIVPSQEEYLEEAKECLGMPMPDPSEKASMWYDFQRGVEVARVHQRDHIWFPVAMGTLFCAYNMYISILGTYEDMLLGSPGAGDYITYMNTLLQGSCGTVAAVCLGMAIDEAGNQALVMLFAFLDVVLLLITVVVAGPTWFHQMSCIVLAVILNSCLFPATGRYAITYCLPMQVGIFIGVLYTAAIVVFVGEMTFYYVLLSVLPPESIPRLMTTMFGVATVVMGAYVVRFCFVSLPETPVILPDDEKMICEPFGCNNFDEVLYVLHMEKKDKGELLRLLGKPTKENIKELESRFDVMRSWMLSTREDEPLLGELYLSKLLPKIFSFVAP